MMERKQLIDTLTKAIGKALADTHTTTIGKVISVGAKTIDIKPVINRVVNGESVELPVFKNVLPVFLGGGSSSITMPISVGDYALLIFTERCFDRWYNGQDFQPPLEARMHDYSDGFAIVGLQPESGLLPIPTDITITGDVVHNGNVTINGSLTVNGGDVVADGISLKNHTHTYTWTGSPGSGSTGAPS
jgi:hypothetical protein